MGKSKTIKNKDGIKIEEISPGVFRATTEKSKYIIEYDKNACIGAASCAAIASETFFMDDENRAQFRTDTKDFDEDDIVLAGAQSCPVFAIKIYNKKTGELIFPVEIE
jgi:ferredoxin